MSTPPCASPIAFALLVDYWFGELEGEREHALEEHVFACAHCSSRLEALADLGAGVRAVFRDGSVRAVLSQPFVDRMKGEGLRVREYRVPAGGSVACTISAADDLVVARLQAPLAGVRRLDLHEDVDDGRYVIELRDVPFDAEAGEVILCPTPALLKKMPAHVARVRLVAVDEAGERTLGEYRFDHTPG